MAEVERKQNLSIGRLLLWGSRRRLPAQLEALGLRRVLLVCGPGLSAGTPSQDRRTTASTSKSNRRIAWQCASMMRANGAMG